MVGRAGEGLPSGGVWVSSLQDWQLGFLYELPGNGQFPSPNHPHAETRLTCLWTDSPAKGLNLAARNHKLVGEATCGADGPSGSEVKVYCFSSFNLCPLFLQ